TDDFNKNEFYVGYSGQNLQTSGDRIGANGFEVSYTRNFRRLLGIRGSFTGAFNNRNGDVTFTDQQAGTYSFAFEEERSSYNALVGLQIKDNSGTQRIKPFAYALVGIASNKTSNTNTCISGMCPPGLGASSRSDTGFGSAFGGGIDLRVNDKIEIRLIQADFNPIYSNFRSDNNFRIGAGIVFK
ncbi:MAG: hypothetical protein AB7J13_07120, partial [Pyrinomonadaceae bacterium]